MLISNRTFRQKWVLSVLVFIAAMAAGVWFGITPTNKVNAAPDNAPSALTHGRNDADAQTANAVVWVLDPFPMQCTGTLVAADIVLTAGHCISPRGTSSEDALPQCADWQVPGRWYPLTRPVAIGVGNDRAHFRFQTEATQYNMPGCADMMMLRLAVAVPGDIAQPIHVLTSVGTRVGARDADHFRGATLRLVGWGETGAGTSPEIRQVGTGRYHSNNDERMFVDGDGSVVLQGGDSGSPLIWIDSSGRPHVIGVAQGWEGDLSRFTPTFRNAVNGLPPVSKWVRMVIPEYAPGKGWVWGDQPSSTSYTPSPHYQYNAKGLTNQVSRLGVGQYRVEFPGMATSGGTVQVSAYGGNHTCKVMMWSPSGSSEMVYLRCFDQKGSPADGRFTVLFFADERGDTWSDAYLWANQPMAASYTPEPSYQWNSHGYLNTMQRLGRGNYLATLPGISRTGGTVLITAYGSDSARCKSRSWSVHGTDTVVSVRCFKASGAPVDTRYTLSYMTDVGLGINVSEAQDYGGYVWANDPTATSYTPAGPYQFNNTGRTNTAGRLDGNTGQYRVRFPSLKPGNRSTAVITAYGAGKEYCTIKGWTSDGSTGTYVYVQCYDYQGKARDARFTLTYLTDEAILF